MHYRLRPVYITYLITIVLVLSGKGINAQNLVPNWSFEDITECPEGIGGFGPTIAPPWIAPTLGSPDIFNPCALDLACDAPANGYGYQNAITGAGYAGIWCKLAAYEYREYLQAPLTQPLLADTWYHVTFYVSLANGTCAIETIGAYFSVTAPAETHSEELDYVPQIEYLAGFMNDSVNWIPVSGCFLAEGGESFITIGNFHGDDENPVMPGCGIESSYYYIEDVMVEEGPAPEILPLELGDPVIECFSYTIDPEVTDYFLIWEDGSHGPTLTVTETGIYSLTITDGCNYGEDSIEVTIIGNIEPIDIGPEGLTLCNGEEYMISLDADLSEYTWQDGSHDPEYTISTAGIYSVTLDDGCGEYTDQIEITIVDPPVPIDFGNDVNLCSGEEILLELDPALGNFIWQDGSTGSSYNIVDDGTYSVTVSNMCGESTDEIIFTDLEVPVVDIGPDEHTLCTGDELVIEVDPALGDILWQDGSMDTEYEITTAGMYTLYVSNECGTGSDQVQVFVIDPPVVDLGPDVLVCGTGQVILTTVAVYGDYVWQDFSQNDSLVVSSPGVYALTISNDCGAVTDNVAVDYLPLLNPFDFGPDVILCPGEELALHADHQNASYLWQDGSTSDSFLVNTAGTYSVLLSNACSSVSDTIIVSINNNPPSVDLPSQLSLCQGQSITLDAGISGVSYLWSDNSQNQQLLVASPGTYSLTVSNACGADQDTVMILDGGPAPVVSLGNDIQICPGEHMLLSPSFSNVDTWLWHDGSALPSFDISSAGLISVAVSNSCGSAFDTLMVDLLPATPPLDLGPDTSLCSWQSFTLSIQTPGVSVLWSDGSTTPDFIVSGPGEVTASISNACGSTFDTIIVDALPDVPILDLGPDQSLCPGEIINVDPGIPDVNYLWQNGSVNNTYQSTQQELIILTISNDCASSTDTLEIIESTQGPQVNLGPDIQECEGTIVTIPSGISGVTYLWQDGSTNSDFTTTQSGVFILQVSNSCGNDADTLSVDISGVPPTIALGPDTTLCEGTTLVLVSNADAITSLEWQDGSSSATYTVSSAGIFTLSESNRCGDASDTIVISYLDAPDPFSLGPDTVLCPGESIMLTAPSTAFDILWQDGSNEETIIADQPITYTLQLSNNCGTISDDLVLSFDTRIPLLDLGPDQKWCEGDVFTLDATQPFAANYLWSNGSTSPSIQITTPGFYTVDVSTLCSASSQDVDITPGTDCKTPEVHADMYIPNVFSPNGDGINDVFTVSFGQDLEITRMIGSIFDRWGNLVFSSENIPFSWDGRFNDEGMMPGVYVLVLRWSFNDLGEISTEVVHRDVTLLR